MQQAIFKRNDAGHYDLLWHDIDIEQSADILNEFVKAGIVSRKDVIDAMQHEMGGRPPIEEGYESARLGQDHSIINGPAIYDDGSTLDAKAGQIDLEESIREVTERS